MPAEPDFQAPDPREVDPRVVRRAFGRAVATYDAAAALQREVGARMASRLEYVRVAPALVLDAGCGTGEAVGELSIRYPGARVVALDLALPMVAAARERARHGRSLMRRLLPAALSGAARAPWFVCGDVNALPLRGVAFDLVWSNLALQWVNDAPRAFAELRRVLAPGGLLMFSTFGPDTLKELRAAFADGYAHTQRFIDMHDLGDMLVGYGFADPVMDMEVITLTYDDLDAMFAELRAAGSACAMKARHHGLTGRQAWAEARAAYERMRRDGKLPATFEVVYGHAWKTEAKQTADGRAIVRFDLPRKK